MRMSHTAWLLIALHPFRRYSIQFVLPLCAAVTSELVRLTTEVGHLQQEKQSAQESCERITEKAANLVNAYMCVL